MYKSKLIDILKTFNKRELRKLSVYIISPFFNKKEEVQSLYHFVKKYHPHFDHVDLDRKHVFAQIFPNKPFKEQDLRYIMTDLTKLVESFLMHQELNKDKKLSYDLLISIYEKRKLDKYFNSTIENYRKLLKEKKDENAEYYLTLHKLEEKLFHFKSLKENHIDGQEIIDILKNIDIYYFTQKIKYSCEIYNSQNNLGGSYQKPMLLDPIIEYLEGDQLNQPNVTIMYYYVLMGLLNPQEDKYVELLLAQLKKHEHTLGLEVVRNLYIYSRNYYLQRYLREEEGVKYLRPIFELYRKNLHQKILLIHDELIHWDYVNIVQLGLYFKQFDFVEQFIPEYKAFIQVDQRIDAYTYCLSCFYFAQGAYDKTVGELNEVTLNSAFYFLDAKKLLTQCYYELKEYETLSFLIEATLIYIKRNKSISDNFKVMYRTFFSLVKKLVRIKNAQPLGNEKQIKRSINSLKKEIEQVKRVNDWAWLSAKIEGLGI